MKLMHMLAVLMLIAAPACAEIAPLPIDLSGGMPVSQSNLLSETVYEDASIRVELSEQMAGVTKCHIARVTIADPTQLRTAPAYAFNRDQVAPMDAIAKRVNAVVAVNGDYFSYQRARGSFMIRQGQQYIDDPIEGRDVLIIDSNGDFHIEPVIDEAVREKFRTLGIVNSFNFGPGIVREGEVLMHSEAAYNAAQKKAARSCIAQIERGRMEYLIVVSEGPDESSGGGLTLVEFAAFVSTLGVQNAYNLDGGNSAALIFMGEKINAADNPYHRPLSDIIYFGSAVQE